MREKFRFIYLVYFLDILFLSLSEFDIFDTKIQLLKSLVYYGFIALTPIVFILNFFYFKSIYVRILFSIILVIVMIYFNILQILFSISVWNTQTILYNHKSYSNYRIETQTKDIGAFGYNNRIAKVLYLSDYFYFVVEEDKIDSNSNWIKVDLEINELNLK